MSTSTVLRNQQYVFGGPYKTISNLEFLEPKVEDAIPIYQVLKPDGTLINPSQDPQVIKKKFHFVKIYVKIFKVLLSLGVSTFL